MIETVKKTCWQQFGATLDMLGNAINLCPDALWDTDRLFWYWSFHCLFWTDYYLTLDPDSFTPPAPFTFSEFESGGAIPDRTYTKEELLNYLKHCSDKAFKLINSFTEESVQTPWVNKTKNFTVLEILLYNMRHVQHHAAQFNKILREEIDQAPSWVSVAKRNIN